MFVTRSNREFANVRPVVIRTYDDEVNPPLPPPELIVDGDFSDGLSPGGHWSTTGLDYWWTTTTTGYYGNGSQFEAGNPEPR